MYKLFLTFRYLTRRPLSLVAMLVLSVAIAVLVVAPSIMAGFQQEFRKRLRGALSDLSIESAKPLSFPEDPKIERYLASLPGVAAVAPFVENPALDKNLHKIDYCFLRGIDPRREEAVSDFKGYFLSDRELFAEMNDLRKVSDPEERAALEEQLELLPDEPDLERIYRELEEGSDLAPGLPTLVCGLYYLKAKDLQVGDTVRLTTASDEGEVNEDRKFVIVGAFSSGRYEYDRRLLVMSVRSLQELIGIPGKLSGYSLRLVDYEKADLTKAALSKDIRAGIAPLPRGIGYFVKTWEERNENLLKAVRMEELLIWLMTLLIVVAASASIFLVLFMTVHSKVRELGILRAVGATRSGVLVLFVGQGFLIAFVGMVLGLVVGVLFGTYINEIADWIHSWSGWHPFPPDVYYLDRIPVRFVNGDIALNFVITLCLGGLAAVVPGTLAALRPPLKSIRYE
ncbi:MAG: ABC transporter permease [Planctomycetota bacterium]|nr:MAG: ABC transporter permease [Planctomycetota bacterium]